MGEGRRRKLAGAYPARTQSLSRADAIGWAWDVLAAAEDDTVSGITLFPADGSEPVYLSTDDAKRPAGAKALRGPNMAGVMA